MAQDGRDEKGLFIKGNLFSIGNNGGKPPEYKTPQDLVNKIAEYLDWEDSQKRPDSYSKMGKGIYTISGCALYLGFCSRSSIEDQANRGSEYSDIISRFKLFMTHWNEQKLYWGGTFMAAQFWLKNFGGYQDEVTQNSNIKSSVKIEVVPSTAPLANNEKDIDLDE